MPNISFDVVDNATRLKQLNVNKAVGPDGIQPRENSEILAYSLKIIKNDFLKSFYLKILPLDWRSSNITIIFKIVVN